MNRQKHIGPIFYPYVVRHQLGDGFNVWYKAYDQLPHIVATFATEEQARAHAIDLNQSYRQQADAALALRRQIDELSEGTAPSSSTEHVSLLSRVKALLRLP